VLFSLLVARLITPMLAAYFMRDKVHEEPKDGFIMRAYTGLVGWSVRHKYLTFLLGIAFFAGSIYSTKLLPTASCRRATRAARSSSPSCRPGSRLDDTKAVTDRLAARLREMPEVRSVFVNGGVQLPGKKEVRPRDLHGRLCAEVRARAAAAPARGAHHRHVPRRAGYRFVTLNANGLRALQLIVSGPDQNLVIETAAKLQREMGTIAHLSNPLSTAPLNRPEIRIRPKPAVAAELAVSTDVIAETVRVGTIGDIGANLAKFDAGDRQVPIRVQLPESVRGDRQLLELLKVPAKNGAAVPLSAVADVELGQGPTSIDRYDRALRVALEADLNGTDALGEVLAEIFALPTAKNLPAGVTIKQTGDAEVMTEVFESFGKAMGAGIMMVLGVLILLFANFFQPFTILLSLPLSIGGAILALVVTQKAISLPVVIGFLMLMGIVTKNAILLVDFAVEEIAKGVERNAAIVDAGRKRARPIVMTTIAMAAGMIPSAMAFGEGGEFRSPMAIAVIGGLLVSTMLSLVFVPAFFVLMDDLSRLMSWAFGRFVGPSDEPEDEPELPAAVPGVRLGNHVVPYPARPTRIAAE
jgi:multidrug efflux pump subunit AcrB